ncbi:MAG: hypothetical protein ACO1NZ_17730 [Adhaeribacter sp.]
MTTTKYKNVWLAFVQIKPEEDYSFGELIESDEENEEEYIGAWANILIKADTLNEALEIVPLGLKEKNFEVVFIDKIENVQSLVEYEEIDLKVLKEIDWMLTTEYVFIISNKIFPYAAEA